MGSKVPAFLIVIIIAGIGAAIAWLVPRMAPSLSPEELAPAAVVKRLDKSQAAKKEKDLKTAADLLLPLAQSSQAEAQFQLGLLYREDEAAALLGAAGQLGTPGEDYQNAGKWLLAAAQQGHLGAQATLGIHYCWGEAGSTTVRTPSPEGLEWLQKAAKAGYVEAQRNLATTYLQGICVKQDYAEAAKWFMESAGQGDEWSMISLARMSKEGQGLPKDEIQHHVWIVLAGLDKDMKQRNRLSPAVREEVEKRVKEWSDNRLRFRHE